MLLLLQAALKHSDNCTFTPQITAKSQRLEPRSVSEMSRGDQLKRETSVRLSRLRAEQSQLEDVTFKPQLNEGGIARTAKSHLQVGCSNYPLCVTVYDCQSHTAGLRECVVLYVVEAIESVLCHWQRVISKQHRCSHAVTIRTLTLTALHCTALH
jgi:hypothetical protein